MDYYKCSLIASKALSNWFLVLLHFHLVFSTKQQRHPVKKVHITPLLKTLQQLLPRRKNQRLHRGPWSAPSCPHFFLPVWSYFLLIPPCKHIHVLTFSSKHAAQPLLTDFAGVFPPPANPVLTSFGSSPSSGPHSNDISFVRLPWLLCFPFKALPPALPCFIFHTYLSWADISVTFYLLCVAFYPACPTIPN